MTEINVKASFVFEDVFSSGISGIADVKKKKKLCSQLSCCLSCLFFISSLKSARRYHCCSLSGIGDFPAPKWMALLGSFLIHEVDGGYVQLPEGHSLNFPSE